MTRREGASYDDNTGALLVTLGSGGTIPNPIFTGTAGFDAGTVGAPSIYWTSDADGTGTGLYRAEANAVSVAANGAEKFRVAAAATYSFQALYQYSDTIGIAFGASQDSYVVRGGANQFIYSGAVGAGATATSRAEINKAVTAFTNAAAKAVFTITIPNAAHSASILVRVTGSLGAGGAIGANEATATNAYMISLTRTPGVNATAAISAAFGAAATAVAGAATVTCTAAMSTVTGAVGASNSFTVDVTITRSGGSSDNHTCVATASLLNANATGITIA